jgi:hypothetical protein
VSFDTAAGLPSAAAALVSAATRLAGPQRPSSAPRIKEGRSLAIVDLSLRFCPAGLTDYRPSG